MVRLLWICTATFAAQVWSTPPAPTQPLASLPPMSMVTKGTCPRWARRNASASATWVTVFPHAKLFNIEPVVAPPHEMLFSTRSV